MQTCIEWPENPEIGDPVALGDTTLYYKGEGVWEGSSTAFVYSRETQWSDVESSVGLGNPTTIPGNWHVLGNFAAWWRAEREFKDGVWSAWSVTRIRGADGYSNQGFKSVVFTRSETQPEVPTGGTWTNPLPDDVAWSDGVPVGELQLWASTRVFSVDAEYPQEATWSTPASMTDTSTTDYEWSSVYANPGTPETNPENWNNVPDENTWWRAERTKVNGIWGAWVVVKIRGEDGTGGDGADGNFGYLSTVFTRVAGTPTRPEATEGTWANPVPVGWSDGVPDGDLALWSTSRKFTDDGEFPQDSAWALPRKMTSTSTQEFNYSAIPVNPGTPTANPTNWHTVGTPSDIWMAQRIKTDGIWGEWQVLKIRGEDGFGASRGFNFFKIGTADGVWSDTVANSALPESTPITNDVVTIYKVTDSNVNVTKFWNGGAWEEPADGGMFFGSILVDGSVISRHVAASISMTTPRMNGGVLNGGTLQLIGSGYMSVQSHTPFGPDNLLEWRGPRLTTGTGDDENPNFSLLRKNNAISWFDDDGNQYFGGTLSAGILRTATSNTTKAEYVAGQEAVMIGPFSTNGDPKSVVVSFSMNASAMTTNNSACPSNPTPTLCTWDLQRKVGTGAWVTVSSGTATGTYTCRREGTDTLSSESNSQSVTHADNTVSTEDFSYRVVVTGYSRYMATSNIQSQIFSLVSTES